MVRGAKAAASKPAPAVKGDGMKLFQKLAAAAKNKVQPGGPSDHARRKRKVQTLTEMQEPEDPSSMEIRRNDAGRKAIRARMMAMYALDLVVGGDYPLFDSDGYCRMRLAGASDFTWTQILEAAPACLDTMRLAFS